MNIYVKFKNYLSNNTIYYLWLYNIKKNELEK